MTTNVKLTTVGDATGIVLPKEVLERLRVTSGDMLRIVDTPNGFELTPCDAVSNAQLNAAEEIMREDRSVLKRLAE